MDILSIATQLWIFKTNDLKLPPRLDPYEVKAHEVHPVTLVN
jgi:hypothetical protein